MISNRSKFIVRLSQLSASISVWFAIAVVCIDNPYRSVEICDSTSDVVAKLWLPENCGYHCQNRYLFKSFEISRINKRIFQHSVNILNGGKSFECCCRFNQPWPKFVQPQAIDRVPNAPKQMKRPYDCMPLGPVKLGLSSRTVDAYDRVCDYLAKKEPLTMLEAYEFANLTSYLNMMQPKNPQIRRTIMHKDMKLVDRQILERLTESIIKDKDKTFLNSFKPVENFEGYELKTTTVRKIGDLLRYHLKEAVKNRILAKAIDEYVLSYVLVDITAAGLRISMLNHELAVPDHILRGDYDQYDEENQKAAFTLANPEDLDCKLLSQTQNRLNIYLSAISSTLSSLKRKGAYEHMCEVNPNMRLLQDSKKIYVQLRKANCK